MVKSGSKRPYPSMVRSFPMALHFIFFSGWSFTKMTPSAVSSSSGSTPSFGAANSKSFRLRIFRRVDDGAPDGIGPSGTHRSEFEGRDQRIGRGHGDPIRRYLKHFGRHLGIVALLTGPVLRTHRERSWQCRCSRAAHRLLPRLRRYRHFREHPRRSPSALCRSPQWA